MQKQAYSVYFHPLPTLSDEIVYFDTAPIALPYSNEIKTLHYHDRYEIGICESGEGIFLSQGIVSYVKKGDVIFVAPNNNHYSRSITKDAPCMCRFAYLNVNAVECLINFLTRNSIAASAVIKNAKESIPPVIRSSRSPILSSYIVEILNVCTANKPDSDISAQLLFAHFLFDARNEFKGSSYLNINAQSEDVDIKSVAEYLSTNFNQNDTVATLARSCHLSESQFRRRFLKAYGISPIVYRNKLRCKIASELLLHTRLSILDISIRIGYSDASDFYRAFKKEYGVAPSTYRLKTET